MFGFLKEKLKNAVKIFSRKVEEEADDEVVKEEVKPVPKQKESAPIISKPSPKKEEIKPKKAEPVIEKKEIKPTKEIPKQEIKKETPKPEIKKEIPKTEIKKEVPKPELKKEVSKIEVKKEEPKPEIKKETIKTEVKKEEPKTEIKKIAPSPPIKNIPIQKEQPRKETPPTINIPQEKSKSKVEIKKELQKEEEKLIIKESEILEEEKILEAQEEPISDYDKEIKVAEKEEIEKELETEKIEDEENQEKVEKIISKIETQEHEEKKHSFFDFFRRKDKHKDEDIKKDEEKKNEQKENVLDKIKQEEKIIQEKEIEEKLEEETKEDILEEEIEEVREEIVENKKEKKNIIKEEEIIEEQSDEKETKESEEEVKDAETKEDEEQEETEEEPEKKGFFSRLKETFTKKLSDEKFEELFWDIELALLENNASIEVVEKIKMDLKANIVGKSISKSDIVPTILSSLKESISDLFDVPKIDLIKNIEIKNKEKLPYIISFIGVNGSGKTTQLAKIAHYLKKHHKTCVIASCDTFRAAAIQQLEQHANKLEIKMIKHNYGADPAAVAFDAIEHAKAKGINVVLIDTAGRLHSNDNLMQELKKLVRVAKPDLNIFVGESITGNDCVEQAKQFGEFVNIDGIILTKADVDDKGGAAISISYITGKPIMFFGNGQSYDDLKEFDKKIILESLEL